MEKQNLVPRKDLGSGSLQRQPPLTSPDNPPPEVWWEVLERQDTPRNFWMTHEWVERKGLLWVNRGLSWGYAEEGEPGWYLPPYCPTLERFFTNEVVWAGFPDWPCGHHNTVLDRQYLYDPRRFLDLSGGAWKVYRKNIRKFPERTAGKLDYHRMGWQEDDGQAQELLMKWAEGRELFDPEVLADFVLNGNLRWGLYLDGRLIGINVGDINQKHMLFRYCVDNGAPFLNEYLRHQFYIHPDVLESGRLVNDGGDLGNEGLARFKQKLNPVAVQKVYSYQPAPADSKAGG